jgi:hypothetical protein
MLLFFAFVLVLLTPQVSNAQACAATDSPRYPGVVDPDHRAVG